MLTFKQKLETQELGVHGANFITIVSLQKISLLLRLKKKDVCPAHLLSEAFSHPKVKSYQ